MRNRFKSAALPLLTLALIAAGAAMPYAACRLQDARLAGGAEDRSFDSVSLTLRQEGGVGETARLMAGPYSVVEWSGETAMTEEEALGTGMKVLEDMKQADLIPASRLNLLKKLGSGSATPLLVVSEDGERSGIIWQCWWMLEEDDLMDWILFIEDATGQMAEATVGGAYYAYAEDVYRQMERWRSFFQDYYGIEIPAIQESAVDDGWVWNFLLPFDPRDGLEEWCALGLSLYDGVATFFFTDAGQMESSAQAIPPLSSSP